MLGIGGHEGGSQRFSKHRAEALSDAVFPIAMTVLVLNLKVPTVTARGELWAVLSSERVLWTGIVITFVTTSLFWMLQHRVFEVIETMSRQTMRLTLLTLGFVTMLPFSTQLLGQGKGDPLAFELYFSNHAAVALSMALKLEVARWRGELYSGAAVRPLRLRLWGLTLVMLSAVAAVHFWPERNWWIVPAVLGTGFRLLRLWFESGWRKASAS